MRSQQDPGANSAASSAPVVCRWQRQSQGLDRERQHRRTSPKTSPALTAGAENQEHDWDLISCQHRDTGAVPDCIPLGETQECGTSYHPGNSYMFISSRVLGSAQNHGTPDIPILPEPKWRRALWEFGVPSLWGWRSQASAWGCHLMRPAQIPRATPNLRVSDAEISSWPVPRV